MITRWQYCLSAEIITIDGTTASPNRRETPLISKAGWGTTERERQMDRNREKGVGKMKSFKKKEDKSLIDVENVENTRERCCHLS